MSARRLAFAVPLAFLLVAACDGFSINLSTSLDDVDKLDSDKGGECSEEMMEELYAALEACYGEGADRSASDEDCERRCEAAGELAYAECMEAGRSADECSALADEATRECMADCMTGDETGGDDRPEDDEDRKGLALHNAAPHRRLKPRLRRRSDRHAGLPVPDARSQETPVFPGYPGCVHGEADCRSLPSPGPAGAT